MAQGPRPSGRFHRPCASGRSAISEDKPGCQKCLQILRICLRRRGGEIGLTALVLEPCGWPSGLQVVEHQRESRKRHGCLALHEISELRPSSERLVAALDE